MNTTQQTAQHTPATRLLAAVSDISQDGRYAGWKQDVRSVCNSHEALVAALRNIEDVAAKVAKQTGSAQVCFIRDEARAALAAAAR